MTGKKFGRLTVIEYDHRSKWDTYWLCKCECGNEIITSKKVLQNGSTKSCGCYRRERQIEANKKYNKYDINGEYGVGYTTKGEEFYFDLEDFDKIKEFAWYKSSNGYILNKQKNKCTMIHRLVTDAPRNKDVDHINRNKVDNRKRNLRIVDRSMNIYNKSYKPNKQTGVRGVNKLQSGRYSSCIGFHNKHYYLGSFDTLEEAINARKKAELFYFKELSFN